MNCVEYNQIGVPKMKTFLLLSYLASLIFFLERPDLAQAAETSKIKISSYITVELGGDLAQYEDTLAYSRDQTRRMYMNEIVDAAAKLSAGLFYPTDMLYPLLEIQDAANNKRDINKIIDSAKIGISVGEFFKSEIEKLHKANGITDTERKMEFVNVFPVINGHLLINPEAQYDHYIFIHMAHIGNGQFRIVATLGSINMNGFERSFEAKGFLNSALAKLAENLFRSVMEVARPAWKNPNQSLIWIPGPANLSTLDQKEANLYCPGQEARLPLADELILAHHGTTYRNGGIERFQLGENYFVADQMRQAGNSYYVTFQDNGASVRPVVGQVGKVWCVTGEMSERNTLIQKLYSVRRKFDSKGVNIRFFPENVSVENLSIIIAIESLLIHLNAAGAEINNSLLAEDLMSIEDALVKLKLKGISITIPKSVLHL